MRCRRVSECQQLDNIDSQNILYTMELEKHSLLRKRNEQHRNIIKKYKVHYSPLFLPRLAIIGYHLRPDPSCQIFFSKLQLTDKTILQRENDFIDLMKTITASQEGGSGDDSNQLLLIQWFKGPSKSVKVSSKLLEEKHRYGQILNSRLNDLNELIFHIERFNHEPLLEKQCRQLLQKEITRIKDQQSQFNRETNDETEGQENRASNPRKLFSLAQFKLDQKKIKNQNIKDLYRQKNRKDIQGRRLVTEPNHIHQKNASPRTKFGKRNSAIENSCQDEIDNLLTNQKNLSKGDHPGRNSLINTYNDTNKENLQKTQHQNTSRRIGGIVKTEAHWRRPSNRRQMKSVRYMLEDDEAHTSKKDQKQSYSSKFSANSNLKSSRSIRFKELETYKMAPASNFASKKKVSQRNILRKHSKHPSNVSNLKRQDESCTDQQNQDEAFVTEEFEKQSVSKKIYVPQKEVVRPARRKQRKPKLSAFLMWDDQLQAKQVHRSNKKTKSKPRINIFKRQKSNKEVETASAIQSSNPKPSHIKAKRNGKLLGADANKHLQRLLRQSNVEEMLLQNELYQANQSFNKIKQSVHRKFGSLTLKQIDRLNDKHVFSANNKILMEVDLEAQHKLLDELKTKHYDEYVKNHGLAVKLEELKTFRKDYVDITTYYQNFISSFYGGDKASMMNFEFITNERGQYSFNREFIQKMSKDPNEEDMPYRFPQCDPCDFLAFELGSQLIRECQNLSQKQLIKSSILVDQPDAIPLVLY